MNGSSDDPNPTIKVLRADGEVQTVPLGQSTGGASAPRKVSCLMVSRGDVGILRHSFQCYLNQDYPARQLVLVTQNPSAELEEFLSQFPDADIKYVKVGAGLSLGDLRNVSIAHADGPLICTWDDDDLYHPSRLSLTIAALESAKVAAAFLSRVLIWWPARRVVAISEERPWENSMVAVRWAVPVYPAMARGSDTWVLNAMRRLFAIALLDRPRLYCRTVTGHNAWPEHHFETMMGRAGQTFQSDDYRKEIDALEADMPIRAYAGELTRRAGKDR
jgi:glycosyltransferase involved in cell wall biosynthesis